MDRDRVWAYEIGLRDPDVGLSALHIFALEDSDDDGDEDEFDLEKYEVGPLADYGMSLCGDYYLTRIYGEPDPVIRGYVERREGESNEDFETRLRYEAARLGRRMCPKCVAKLYESLP